MSLFISVKVRLFEPFEVTVTRISAMNGHRCGYSVNSGMQLCARQPESSIIALAGGDFFTIMIDAQDVITIGSGNVRIGRTFTRTDFGQLLI
jgi:hypothetical protein